MQMRPRGDISKVAVRDGAAKRFENANFHDHTLKSARPAQSGARAVGWAGLHRCAAAFVEAVPHTWVVGILYSMLF